MEEEGQGVGLPAPEVVDTNVLLAREVLLLLHPKLPPILVCEKGAWIWELGYIASCLKI